MSKTAALTAKLAAANSLNYLYKVFQHYRGGIYIVEGFVIDTDDGEVRVLYSRIAGPDYDAETEAAIQFVRPLREFLDETVVIRDDKPVKVPRFKRVQKIETWVPLEEEDSIQ